MNALHVIPAIAARYGGPSTAVLGLGRALKPLGVGAVIATTDADGAGRMALPYGRIVSYEGADVIVFRRWASESAKLSPSLAIWLRAHAGDYDVVHIHGLLSHACVAAAHAARRARVPFIVRPLGTLDPVSLAQKPRRKALALRLMGERILRSAAAVQCTAPDEAAAVAAKFTGVRTVVLPLGIDDEAFAPAASTTHREPLVLCVTRLTPWKGLERLIDAFDAVASDPALSSWQLVIAGDGEPRYRAALEQHRERARTKDRIVVAGWVDRGQKRAWLGRASVFALASRHESFGVAVAEALAAGVPAVIAKEVQLGHWIAPAVAGWVSHDDGDFAACLRTAMTNPSERLARGQAATTLAEQFRWPRIAADVSALYQQVRRSAPELVVRALPAR